MKNVGGKPKTTLVEVVAWQPVSAQLDLSPSPPPSAPDVLSVADFNRRIRLTVEGMAPPAWVEGEVGSLKVAASGHVYFTLKDEREDACLDCVIYRAAALRARSVLADGGRIHLRGKATFWSPRGRLQFVADAARAAGRGALLEALERLKAKLLAEGLFAPERKRPLPSDPQCIGIVTSASGAALHDIVNVAFRRGGARFLLSPATVQGADAPAQIIAALDRLEQVAGLDVIIVGRGGGASEDLAAFQDERVVRRVAACRVPVVSAVGHEVDVTLTDLVADARAATPSQAAELIVPDLVGRVRILREVHQRLRRTMTARIAEDRLVLVQLRSRLGDPRGLLGERQQLLDDLQGRLQQAARRSLADRRQQGLRLGTRLAARHPRAVLLGARAPLADMDRRLRTSMRRRIDRAQSDFRLLAGRLHELSPLAVLGRGYAVALRSDGRTLTRARDAHVGETLRVRLHRGDIVVNVATVLTGGSGEEET